MAARVSEDKTVKRETAMVSYNILDDWHSSDRVHVILMVSRPKK